MADPDIAEETTAALNSTKENACEEHVTEEDTEWKLIMETFDNVKEMAP